MRPHAPTTPLGSETRDTPRDATSMSACARQPSPASAPASARRQSAYSVQPCQHTSCFAALRRSCSCTPQQPCTHREHLSLRAMMAASDANASRSVRHASVLQRSPGSAASGERGRQEAMPNEEEKGSPKMEHLSFFFCAFCLSTFACMLLRCVSVHAACFAQRARRVRSSRSARMQGDGPAP